jgi:phenylpyruvate tautomerase PptA (4-oxalocrotonate tautomerase family)
MALARLVVFDDREVDVVAAVEAVHTALVDTLRVPSDDPTVWASVVPPEHAIVGSRPETQVVLVDITLFSGRTDATKRRLHETVATALRAIGVSGDSIVCVLRERDPASWSVGGAPQDEVDVGFDITI